MFIKLKKQHLVIQQQITSAQEELKKIQAQITSSERDLFV